MNNVAICGYGTVGKGVKDLLDALPKESGVRLLKVLDVPAKKAELGSLLVTDYHTITEDPSISTVFECLGGDELPQALIVSALKAGKNVISSNKETLSRHLKEYLALREEHHASLQFEASVGGGIPLLYPLSVIARFDKALSLQGILNGTTNFILTRMGEGSSFASALQSAQEKGFAEKDPTADLEGLDLVRKTSILASLLYGVEAPNEAIVHFGISHVEKPMLEDFKKAGKVLRFLVDIHPYKEGLSLVVMPTLLPPKALLSGIGEETNAVSVLFEKNGPLSFVGKGAGRNPTASAMMQDFERVLSHSSMPLPSFLKEEAITPDLRGSFYAYDQKKSLHILHDPSLAELQRSLFLAKVAEE
jgi:homoserine dehydrogenase